MAHGNKTIPIPGELKSTTSNGVVTSADGVYDYSKGKFQEEVNENVSTEISNIKGGSSKSIKTLEDAIDNQNVAIQQKFEAQDAAIQEKEQQQDASIQEKFNSQDQTIDTKFEQASAAIASRQQSIEEEQQAQRTYIETELGDQDHKLDNIQATVNAKQLEIGAVETDLEPTEHSANRLTSGTLYDVYGHFIESPEYVRVVLDRDEKVLYGVQRDGNFFFGAGCPQQVIDYVRQNASATEADVKALIDELDAKKVDKVEGMSLINEEYAATKSTIDSPEFLEVTTDSEDKVLEGIQADGTKVIGGDLNVGGSTNINGDIRVLGNMELSGVSYKVIENPEWIKVLTDAQDRIIAGVRKDGNVYIGQLEGLDDKLQEMLTQMQQMLDEAEAEIDAKLEVFNSVFNIVDNPEWIQVTTNSEGKILEGITAEGKKKVMVDVEYPNGIPSEIKKYVDNYVEEQRELSLKGKTIVCFGDSITMGTDLKGYSYSEYIAKKTGATVINAGFGGTTWLQGNELVSNPSTDADAIAWLCAASLIKGILEQDFTNQIIAEKFIYGQNVNSVEILRDIDWYNVDYVTFLYGTNDFNGYSTSLGTSGNEDVRTTLGSLNYCVHNILAKYQHLKVYMFTPIVRWFPDEQGRLYMPGYWCDDYVQPYSNTHLYDHVDAIEKESILNHLPVCNLYYTLGWNKYNVHNYFQNNDGTHPRKGFEDIANKIIKFIESN